MNGLDASLAAMVRGDGAWPPGADPEALLRRAELHGVVALLHEAGPRGAPGAVQTTLRERSLRMAALELGHRQELLRLLDLMAGAGVRPILMKGTPLAYSVYRQPVLRQRGDTDVLVRPDQRGSLLEMLQAQGYRRAEDTGSETASSEASFGKDGSPLVLDVHWRINSSPLLSPVLEFAGMEARAEPVPALGPHARAPGPIDAVLLAAMHRAKHHHSPVHADGVPHRGDRLIWLYDLHLLVPSLRPAQVEELAQRAVSQRVAGLCLDALRRAREVFATAVPSALVERLERAAVRPEPSMVLLRGGRRRLLLAEVRALPGWGERWRLLREHALPPADYMLRKYQTRQRWLLPALYVRRALGWLAR